jgi:hypothetical protein
MRSHNLLAVILGAPFMMQHQAVLGYLPQVAMYSNRRRWPSAGCGPR